MPDGDEVILRFVRVKRGFPNAADVIWGLV